jgi:hypothetical protein
MNQRKRNSSFNNVIFPLTSYQIDMAACTHSYQMEYGCVEVDHPFWSDSGVRSLLTKHRFEAHEPFHRRSCFKKGCECRFIFPYAPCKRTKIDADPEQGSVRWHKLVEDEDIHSSPWLLLPRRPLGCEFINTHNHPMSEILNCNTNVQIGDPTQVLYSTLYSSKSTQKEDAEKSRGLQVVLSGDF